LEVGVGVGGGLRGGVDGGICLIHVVFAVHKATFFVTLESINMNLRLNTY
jgi:hypothetical protein